MQRAFQRNRCLSLARQLVTDDRGTAILETTLILGLVTIVCLIAMKGFGASLTLWWNNIATML